jgi:hypothetical protein
MECRIARTMVHEAPADGAVQAHLQVCPSCATYAAYFARLDRILSSTLVVPVPPTISMQLQSLIDTVPDSATRLEALLRAELVTPAPPALREQLLALVPEHTRLPARIDMVLREELMPPVPLGLAAQLQALVPAPKTPLPQLRPRRWVIGTVYAVTAVLLFVGLMVASSLYQLMLTQLGLAGWWSDIAGLPAMLLNSLYNYVPQSRVVVAAVVWLQQPLQWLLAALLLWAALDRSQVEQDWRYA